MEYPGEQNMHKVLQRICMMKFNPLRFPEDFDEKAGGRECQVRREPSTLSPEFRKHGTCCEFIADAFVVHRYHHYAVITITPHHPLLPLCSNRSG